MKARSRHSNIYSFLLENILETVFSIFTLVAMLSISQDGGFFLQAQVGFLGVGTWVHVGTYVHTHVGRTYARMCAQA